MSKKKKESHLSVKKGVQTESGLGKDAVRLYSELKKKDYTAADYIDGIRKGNVALLSQAITLVESQKPEHLRKANEILSGCLPFIGKSIRIGVTGVPGVGKSTFIEAFGKYLISQGSKVAVLAVDPSSSRSKGSIMGDKTRMDSLSSNQNAFIRPSPSGGALGGVARKTRESIFLCEAAGYDVILVETVGVGQSETAVHSMVDYFLLLMLAGAGDELQGVKRGIMEMADCIVINKADGDNVRPAEIARQQYENAIHLFPLPDSKVPVSVATCSALKEKGLDSVWETVQEYIRRTKESEYFDLRRMDQSRSWTLQSIDDGIREYYYSNADFRKRLEELLNDVGRGERTSFNAAQTILKEFL